MSGKREIEWGERVREWGRGSVCEWGVSGERESE